jgi:hypothetical protein
MDFNGAAEQSCAGEHNREDDDDPAPENLGRGHREGSRSYCSYKQEPHLARRMGGGYGV